mmetsp:Transcript_480/g.742  ORF Transcript_480/g.742 Transcript_480/m.742 type:complete len:116 (+) Transcript_480:401-748(+)
MYCPGFTMHDYSDKQLFKTQLKAGKNTMHQLTGHSPVPLLQAWRKVQSQISLALKELTPLMISSCAMETKLKLICVAMFTHQPCAEQTMTHLKCTDRPCCVPSQRRLIQIVGPGH